MFYLSLTKLMHENYLSTATGFGAMLLAISMYRQKWAYN